jgi:hypothetical protein
MPQALYLTVISTVPAAAKSVALALQQAAWPEVKGVIAEDATLFLATAGHPATRRSEPSADRASERPYNDTSWRRLYALIIYLNRRKVALGVCDFIRLLTLNGIQPDAIEEYSLFYQRARAMFDFGGRSPWNSHPSRNLWEKWCEIANSSRQKASDPHS